ncbi:MAG: MFS transporter [Kiritimatiellae bacterium]|nr:MFS transporter [Kiritimatiellia bacterium]
MKKNGKWLMLALLSLAFFFSQADRVLFGLLTIPIQEELGLNDLQIGMANTVFFVVFAAIVPLAGYVGDRFSRKWVIVCALMFWSAMTAFTGFAGSLLGLILFRSVLTSAGECFYCPSAYALISTHHKETRTLALAIHQSALYVGLMFSGAIVAWTLKACGGWRTVFWVFGSAGFVLGVILVKALKDGGEAKNPQCAETAQGTFRDGCMAFVRCPTLLLNAIGFIAINFANNAYVSWAPKFAARKFGISVGEAGSGTMFYHHVCALAAVIAAGFLTDAVVRRGFPRFRLAFQATAMFLGAPSLVFFGFAPTVASCFAATMLYGIFRGAYEANTQTSAFDVVRPENRATVVAVADLGGMLIGSLSPLLLGALGNKYGLKGFEYGFVATGAAYLTGAACMACAALFTFKKDRIDE